MLCTIYNGTNFYAIEFFIRTMCIVKVQYQLIRNILRIDTYRSRFLLCFSHSCIACIGTMCKVWFSLYHSTDQYNFTHGISTNQSLIGLMYTNNMYSVNYYSEYVILYKQVQLYKYEYTSIYGANIDIVTYVRVH